jgi:MOSC domain-containing protein YiiM
MYTADYFILSSTFFKFFFRGRLGASSGAGRERVAFVRRGRVGRYSGTRVGTLDFHRQASDMDGRIFQLNRSGGGVPKLGVREAFLDANGLEGDKQRDLRFHGGPERSLCLFPLELILELQTEGHPVFPGSVGENVTVTGLEWSRVEPGTRLSLGDEALVEITSYTSPCKTIAASFADGDFKRISQKVRPGDSRLYARVLRPGRLAVGDPVKLL